MALACRNLPYAMAMPQLVSTYTYVCVFLLACLSVPALRDGDAAAGVCVMIMFKCMDGWICCGMPSATSPTPPTPLSIP